MKLRNSWRTRPSDSASNATRTTGIATSIQHIIDAPALAPGEAPTADTAVFYSISNCQKGLAGVTFGNFLIKQVAEDLLKEMPTVPFYLVHAEVHDQMCGMPPAASEPLRVAISLNSAW